MLYKYKGMKCYPFILDFFKGSFFTLYHGIHHHLVTAHLGVYFCLELFPSIEESQIQVIWGDYETYATSEDPGT